MFFRQFPTTDSSLSYFFGCATAGKAAAVDVVAGDEESFVHEAAKSKSRITHVIDTHVHADHYSGGRRLATLTGAEYCLHENATVKFRFHKTLRHKILTLPDDVEIFPGHQAGSVCGAGLSGKPSSTLGFEKRWNPLLSKPHDEFVRLVVNAIPPRPADMERIVAANISG